MMKTNNKKKGNTAKKLIPAAMMLAVSASMLATSTYAWFTMNKSVTVTGMELKTTVSSNLQIAATNSESAFDNSLTQSVAALLEPVSTIDGLNYYYTSTGNVKGDGDAKTESYTLYNASTAASTSGYADAFNENYGIGTSNAAALWSDADKAIPYCDYTFYLKAVNTDASAKDIKITKFNLLYNGAAVDTDKAWTSAIFVHSTTQGVAYDTAWAAADVVTIDKMSGASNFSANKAIGSYTDGGNSVVGTTDLSYGSSASTYGATGVLASVAANSTNYYKVTVRVWLEGEDTSCTTSVYNNKTEGYSVDLKFDMDTDTAAVTAIGSSAT